MTIAEAGELVEFGFKLPPLVDTFALSAASTSACSFESFSIDIDLSGRAGMRFDPLKMIIMRYCRNWKM